jgi:hypothetical protein
MGPIGSSFVEVEEVVLVAYQWLLVVVEVKVEEVYQQMVAVEVHQSLVVLEV